MACSSSPIFYGIHTPADVELPDDVTIEPFYTDKQAALSILKKVKPARMKVFGSSAQAEEFYYSVDVSPPPENPSVMASPPVSPAPPSQIAVSSIGAATESLPFKSVRVQDLTRLRQAIEKGDISTLESLVESNPRYLIAAGDTPTMLHERFRYNGLHSAAMKGQTEAAEFLLNSIAGDDLYKQLYPHDPDSMISDRRARIVDLYLNTPDKGNNETPLHFASKFCHPAIVQLLVNEPRVKLDTLNKYEKSASEVAGERGGSAADKNIIRQLLQGQFYVPLYRSEDDDVAPLVGEPWSPTCSLNSSDIADASTHSTDILNVTSPLRAAHRYTMPSLPISAPLTASPLSMARTESPRRHAFDYSLTVKACAGPMSKQQAGEFRRSWSSPVARSSASPRSAASPRTAALREAAHSASGDVARRDPYKGLEVRGRNLAAEKNVGWIEFWSFLGCSLDLKSLSGLSKLEEYLSRLELTHGQESDSVWPNEEPPVIPTLVKIESPISPPLDSGGDVFPPPERLSNGVIDNANEDTDLNSTDDRLATLMDGLTIHSPTSPNYPTHASRRGKSPHIVRRTDGASVNMDHTPSRTYLEMVVPSVSWIMDKARMLWPFGGRRSSVKVHSPASPVPENLPQASPRGDSSPTHTPDRDGREELLHTPERVKPLAQLYIGGARCPSKLDKDVLNALPPSVDADVYPALNRWLDRMSHFSPDQQNSWATPKEARHRERMNEFRDLTPPSSSISYNNSVRTSLNLD